MYVYAAHAVERMFERVISPADVRSVIETGEVVADYPDDRPFPSRLILGFVAHRPIHVVAAFDPDTDAIYVVTAYSPDPELWNPDYKTRRSAT